MSENAKPMTKCPYMDPPGCGVCEVCVDNTREALSASKAREAALYAVAVDAKIMLLGGCYCTKAREEPHSEGTCDECDLLRRIDAALREGR